MFSIELANIAAEAGAEVHIIQHNNRILRAFPQKYTENVIADLEKKGIIFHFDTSLTEIKDDTLIGTNNFELQIDAIIAATGRKPNIDSLNLDTAGISYAKHGITVNNHLQTTNSSVFAIGDVVNRTEPKLTPVASFEGSYIAKQILEINNDPISYPAIAQTAFVSSEISQLGVTIEEAKKNPDQYKIIGQDVTKWYTFNRIKDPNSKVTTIFKNNHLVGAAVISSIAEELINYFNFMITQKITKEQLDKMIFAYPSPASDLKYYV